MAKVLTSDEMIEKMLDQRAILIGGDINSSMGARVSHYLAQLQLQSLDPINLIINSPGGELSPAILLHDFIAHVLTVPVHALVLRECSSAATFILLACSVRKCLPHSRFLIHSGTKGGISLKIDTVTVHKIERLAREVRESAEWAVQFYAQKLKMDDDKVKALIARGDEEFDNSLSAQEAVDIGLVTEIITQKAGLFPLPST